MWPQLIFPSEMGSWVLCITLGLMVMDNPMKNYTQVPDCNPGCTRPLKLIQHGGLMGGIEDTGGNALLKAIRK